MGALSPVFDFVLATLYRMALSSVQGSPSEGAIASGPLREVHALPFVSTGENMSEFSSHSFRHARCLNHGLREAAARCPACRRFFCRECVSEHEGRLLCAECLAEQRLEASPRRQSAVLWHFVFFLAALSVTWLAFFLVGNGLSAIPSVYHDAIEIDAREGEA